MATLDYRTRLANVQARKFDSELNESILSKSYSASQVPDDVKYLLEAMRPIDRRYNEKTFAAADRIQTHLQREFDLHFERAYRTQGSVKTDTNIKVYSDFDLLTIVDKYHYPETLNGLSYKESDPNEDIKELRRQATKILTDIYDEVDQAKEKCITVKNKNLNRTVDIVFAYWYNSDKYRETNNEYYRGLYFYKFPNGPKYYNPDYPFAHIHQVNSKGEDTKDGLRRVIRLLKNLKADSDPKLERINSFHLTTIAYSMDNAKLMYYLGNEIYLAQNLSSHLQHIINDSAFRKTIKSPNGTEYPLGNDNLLNDISSIKRDLDLLIEDAYRDIMGSAALQRAITTY